MLLIAFALFLKKYMCFLFQCTGAKSLQSYPTLCDPMNFCPPGSSVYGILQARILEWVAMPSSKGSTFPEAPALQGGFFTTEPLRKPKIPSLPAIPEPQRWASMVGLKTAKHLDLGSGTCLYLLRFPGLLHLLRFLRMINCVRK